MIKIRLETVISQWSLENNFPMIERIFPMTIDFFPFSFDTNISANIGEIWNGEAVIQNLYKFVPYFRRK